MAIGDLSTRRLPEGSVLIVGAGLAGLYTALELANGGVDVFVLASQRSKTGAASAWAQGGIAAALGPDDRWQDHARDTELAGDGLVDPRAAAILAREGPDRVRDLLALGVPFDRDMEGNFLLGLEAAHSRPRVAKVRGDTAGSHIVATLMRHVRAHERITGLIGWRAESLLSDGAMEGSGGVAGALARRDDGSLLAVEADTTVLATGGVGGLFAVTTNPRTARGDALGMAAVMGAVMRDMEFVQFHPTALDVGRDPAPLATEALRGDGAVLVDEHGERFMPRYHPDAELAPRDDVARAIFAEIRAGRRPYLDARAAVGDHFPEEFPTVFRAAMEAGIDPRTAPIPVAPAVHYHMGGIETDAVARTNLPGLFAVGECAATGVHGANRLASNSLLEAVVYGGRAAAYILGAERPARRTGTVCAQPWLSMSDDVTRTLRTSMSRHCGVRRTAGGLNRLIDTLDGLIDRVGRANPLVAARLIASAALAREESRGGHFRDDFPNEGSDARSSRLTWSEIR